MGERLREVALMPSAPGVELFCVQRERTGVGEELLAQLTGALDFANRRERRHQPERADRERALFTAETVVGLLHAVAEHQLVFGQLLRDREDSRSQSRVCWR